MESELGPAKNDRGMRPLAAFLSESPFPYVRFLEFAVPLADSVRILHATGSAHGQLDSSGILFDGSGEIMLPSPAPGNTIFAADLLSLGAIFYHALTGNPLTDTPDLSALKRIYPVEAKLVVEKLLALHPSGQFVSAAELYSSLVLMKDVYEQSNSSAPDYRRPGSARLYLSLSLIALIIVMVWLIVAAFHR